MPDEKEKRGNAVGGGRDVRTKPDESEVQAVTPGERAKFQYQENKSPDDFE